MNILLTLNTNYLKQMIILMKSLIDHNDDKINCYIISNDLNYNDLIPFTDHFQQRVFFSIIRIDDSFLKDAPTSKRYPKAIYYRIFASHFLPNHLDRVLYLDPDIIINGNLKELYEMKFGENYFIGSTTIKKFLTKFNEIKNNAPKGAPYLNTGVLLMNLELLRKEQSIPEVLEYIKKRHFLFTLPDQDIISGLYGDRIILVEAIIYNLSDRGIKFHNFYNKNQIDFNWVKQNTKIIHYYGKNKPWNSDYKGILNYFYNKYKID